MNKYLYLVSFVFLIASCAIDDEVPFQPIEVCPDEFVGSFELVPTSDDAVLYLDLPMESKIIFVNEIGEEIIYTRSVVEGIKPIVTVPKPCPADETIDLHFKYDAEFKSITIQSLDNPLEFNFSLSTVLDWNNPVAENIMDRLWIYAIDSRLSMVNRFGVFTLIVDERESSASVFNSHQIESIEINNKTFTDVYKTNVFEPSIILYYSLEDGIVAFTDFDEVQWVLDRIE